MTSGLIDRQGDGLTSSPPLSRLPYIPLRLTVHVESVHSVQVGP
jgi:hypothetical protein